MERKLTIAILVAIQAATLFHFRFVGEFGERDSYRMFLGLMDTSAKGIHFNSGLLYNREISFGYYGLFYALAPQAGQRPEVLIAAMNWVALFSVILFVIPEYLVVQRLMGQGVAIASSLILAATPAWWYCGLYGHPITTAMLLFCAGMAVLCRYDDIPSIRTRLGVTGLFAAALMFRFDTVLLFVTVVAILWTCRPDFVTALTKEAFLYVLGSLAVFLIVQKSLPQVSRGPRPPSILNLATTFQIPSHLMSHLRESIIVLGQGFTGLLLVTIPVSAWILLRKRNYPASLFVTGTIVVNLVFWLPNPSPPRHYLMMAPAMSVSAAVMVLELVCWTHIRLHSREWAAGLATALAILGVSEGLHHYGTGRLSYFRSLFEKPAEVRAELEQSRRIAEELVLLPPLTTPVLVLCDADPVIAEMEELGDAPRVTGTVTYADSQAIVVRVVGKDSNQFVMLEQGWDPKVIRNFDQSGRYPDLPILVTDDLPVTRYEGTRPHLLMRPVVDGTGTDQH